MREKNGREDGEKMGEKGRIGEREGYRIGQRGKTLADVFNRYADYTGWVRVGT